MIFSRVNRLVLEYNYSLHGIALNYTTMIPIFAAMNILPPHVFKCIIILPSYLYCFLIWVKFFEKKCHSWSTRESLSWEGKKMVCIIMYSIWYSGTYSGKYTKLIIEALQIFPIKHRLDRYICFTVWRYQLNEWLYVEWRQVQWESNTHWLSDWMRGQCERRNYCVECMRRESHRESSLLILIHQNVFKGALHSTCGGSIL